VSSIIVD